MTILFQSQRLLFREFTAEDAPLTYELNKDPEVTQYVHEPPTTKENAADIMNNIILPQYTRYGHGRWAVHLKTTREFIGWCGLKQTDEHIYPDLGYRFLKSHWGNGYATEAAKRTIEYAFMVLHLQGISAKAHIDNKASVSVLEKCGMQLTGVQVVDGATAKAFVLQAGDFKQLS